MELFTYYMIGVTLMVLAITLKGGSYEDTRTVGVVCLFWPFVLTYVAVLLFVKVFGWDFDFEISKTWFGFRRPAHNWPGFAFSVFKIEFQFWKAR